MADDDADPQVRRFNESFYRADPADYLRTRFQLVLLAGGRSSELRDLLHAGLSYGGITVQAVDPSLDAASDDPELASFLTIESQQLLHHASETALRLFLVHAANPTVPWVELNGLRSFGEFKNRVHHDFIDRRLPRELISWVCLGRSAAPEHDVEGWKRATDGLADFLAVFASRFLDDSNLYNAIKHGLGVNASDAVLLVDDRPIGFGTSVEYPESTEWKGDVRTWSLTTRWVDITESLALTNLAIMLIESIWAVGRSRLLGVPLVTIHVPSGGGEGW